MRMSQAFPSKYLREADLQGASHTVTISKCVIEDVGQQNSPEQKPVIYFSETDKGVVLNKTNGMMIASLYGDETDDWLGKKIVLYPDRVLFGNEMKPCIRVRGPEKQADGPLGGGGTLSQPLDTTANSGHNERNPPPLRDDQIDDEIPF